ncbi:putative coat protein [Sophora japonica powdery mildew-associated partitivirus]|uniref:putative coat protein n=1 Tax=Sophora japonica powdery mildew-associated partitivirus TaxID=1891704 RepID=UPI0008482D73|nr:putative coat protein [Sophora japonica powdery mildew-associated partitivirus]AOF47284.1 putative coat protein [Sophora japonica powdery mildew-associated partitivirus]
MSGKSTKKSSSSKSRDFRKEAGRPSLKKEPVLSSGESSDDSSDAEIEQALDIPVKDDSRRSKSTKGKQRSVASREKKQKQKPSVILADDDTDDEANDDLAKKSESKVAPHMVLITGSTYHFGFPPVTHPATSTFVPWCGNFFSVLFFMGESLCNSTLVQESIPDYFTPVLYWYGSMIFILQILRAREAAGAITRDERTVLQMIIKTYPLEQWTVLSPMIGFLQSLGSVKPTDPMYSWICPAFPPFTGFTALHSYRGMSTVPGIQRMPPILAYQKFIFNFGAHTTQTRDAFVYPQPTITPQNQFVGLQGFGANDDDFQCLTNMYGWVSPPETGSLITVTDLNLKIRTIRRWAVPDVPNNLTVTNLKTFMGLSDDLSLSWMFRVLRQMNSLSNFFPDSTNLANISPTTGLSSIADVDIGRAPARIATDSWYRGRKGITINILSPAGFDDSSQLRLSAATCFNASLADSTHSPLGRQISSLQSGPYFVNDDEEHVSIPLIQYESGARTDPVLRFSEIIESKLFDRNGGRK